MSDAPSRASLQTTQARAEDPHALSELVRLSYPELRRIAAHFIRHERNGHTLQPTALVNEAYLRVTAAHPVELQDQSHFVALLAQAMRRVLVDHARKRAALKREQPVRLELNHGGGMDPADVLTLENALARLEQVDPEKARVVELRFYGGLSTDEIAAVMGVAPRTVKRYWTAARLRLYQDMARAQGARAGE